MKCDAPNKAPPDAPDEALNNIHALQASPSRSFGPLGALKLSCDMSVEFTLELPPFRPALVPELAKLCEVIFGPPEIDLQWRLENMPSASVFCAISSGQLVGFKAGYAMSQTKYYSWLGGVHPEFRKGGIASRLMELQHKWVQERGFKRMETATNQENVAMYQLNLRHGFVVCGLRNEPHRVQVLFSKSLA